MFKEEETQYCPMCEEWAEKYEALEKVAKQHLAETFEMQEKIDKYRNALQKIKEIAKKHAPRCTESANCEYECEECHLSDLKQILEKCDEVNE